MTGVCVAGEGGLEVRGHGHRPDLPLGVRHRLLAGDSRPLPATLAGRHDLGAPAGHAASVVCTCSLKDCMVWGQSPARLLSSSVCCLLGARVAQALGPAPEAAQLVNGVLK